MRSLIFLALVACSGAPDPDAGSADGGKDAGTDAGQLASDAGRDSGCNVLDRDGDGHDSIDCDGDDCADDDPDRFPGNAEICDEDAHDEDCDVLSVGDVDMDGDGFVGADCCNATELEYYCAPDCDDTSATINPDGAETCNDIDDDCNGMVDDGAKHTFYFDFDLDGRGNPADPLTACEPPEQYVRNADDCDDVCGVCWTGHPEDCDGRDNDCDIAVDEGCP